MDFMTTTLDLLGNAWSIFQVIILFGVLVAGHEYGHYLGAVVSGMRVDEFAIGFGRSIFAWKRGETRFTLNIIPFGGYCKIYGMDTEEIENPDIRKERTEASTAGKPRLDLSKQPDYSAAPADDPRAFLNKPLFARFITIIAGPLANIFIAVAMVFILGISLGFPAAEIGGVIPGGPAERAGLESGDVITHLDGARLSSTDDLRLAIYFSGSQSGNQALQLAGFRNDSTFEASVIPQSLRFVDSFFCQLGFVYLTDGTILYVLPHSPASRAGLTGSDLILAVDGINFPSARLDIEPDNGVSTIIVYRNFLEKAIDVEYFEDEFIDDFYSRYNLFLDEDQVITTVLPFGIADDAGLSPGDRIVDSSIDTWRNDTDGINSGEAGSWTVTYVREGVRHRVTLKPDPELSRIQVLMDDASFPVLLDLPSDHRLYTAGMRNGDRIVSINGVPTSNGISAFTELEKNGGNNINIVAMIHEEERVLNVPIPGMNEPDEINAFFGGLHFKTRYFRVNPWESLLAGMAKSRGILEMVWNVLGGLFSGARSVTELAGPVGIATISFEAASSGFVDLINIMVLLSVNLAIFNLLPFPALDGGRLVFMVLEGIFRRPVVTVRLENLIHFGGMILILLFALFITYNDIVRLIFSN